MGRMKDMLQEIEDGAGPRGLVVVVCGDADGNASLVTTPGDLERNPGLKDEDAQHELYCIRGADREDCMREYYRLEGRGEYVPMGDGA